MYVVFLVGILCTLSTAILGEAAYVVKQSEHDRAARYAQLIAEQSTTLYLLAARSQVSAGGVAGLAIGDAWSMHGSACESSVTSCPYAYDAQASVGLGTASSASATQPNDSAMNLQQSYMGEQRASAQLQITIEDRNGVVVARVMRSLTLRVFNAEPWVMISGNKQYSAHAADEDEDAQGDTGGAPAQDGDLPAPDPNYPNGFRDTRIHVTVQCLNDGAGGGAQGNEGTGGVQVSCASTASPSPADAFAASPKPWHNVGGGAPAGWSL